MTTKRRNTAEGNGAETVESVAVTQPTEVWALATLHLARMNTEILRSLYNLIATEGKDHLVSGEVERIDITDGKPRATVRLGEAQEAVVALPSGTPCHAGSKIRLVRRDNVSQHDFRPADPPCAS